MDFSIPEHTQDLLVRMRELVDAELLPLEPRLTTDSFGELSPALDAVREKVKAAGLWAPHLPKATGGMGLDLMTFGLVSEVLGRSPLGHYAFGCQAPDAGNQELLLRHGTAEQRERYLQPLVNGAIRSCFAMTEPETAGANPTLLAVEARDEDQSFVIDGRKWFATGADGAAFAVVMAVTDPHARAHERASMLLVPEDTPGYELVRNVPVMGHTGDGWMSHAELRFDNCRVPKENLLGPQGQGFALAQERLGPGRIHHCMRWIGICRRALDMHCAWATRREVAPNETLAEQQLTRSAVAESAAEIEAARAFVLQTAWAIENQGYKAARDRVSMIKYYTANVLQRVLDRALQAHGALGMTDDTVLAAFYRNERAARIYDGPDEVHRLTVGRRLLRAAQH